MAEIGDLDALLADLQQASAELEVEIKNSPRNRNFVTQNSSSTVKNVLPDGQKPYSNKFNPTSSKIDDGFNTVIKRVNNSQK